MKFQFFGHACFQLEVNGKKLLFDPFISPNEQVNQKVKIEDLNPDYILISHGHFDHIADAEAIAKQSGATVISNFEIITWLGNKGVENGHPMNIGGQWNFDFGTLKMVSAVHSSELPDGGTGGIAGGFVITTDEGNIYFAGDTALTMDMQLIPSFAKLDYAILPIGDNFTMGIDDAIQAAKFVQCNKVLGVHYDTFGFIEINHEEAKEKFKSNGIELILTNLTETINL